MTPPYENRKQPGNNTRKQQQQQQQYNMNYNSGKNYNHRDSSSITRKKNNRNYSNGENSYQGKRFGSQPIPIESDFDQLLTPDSLRQASPPSFDSYLSTNPVQTQTSTTDDSSNTNPHGKELLAFLHEGNTTTPQPTEIRDALLQILDVKQTPVPQSSSTSNSDGLLGLLRTSSSVEQASPVPRKSSPLHSSRISPSRSETGETRYASLISSPAPASLPLPSFEKSSDLSEPSTPQTPTQSIQSSLSPSPSPVQEGSAKHPRQHKFAPKQLFGNNGQTTGKKVYQPRTAPTPVSSGAESSQLSQMSNELKSILNIESL